jgi:hypothetical protein
LSDYSSLSSGADNSSSDNCNDDEDEEEQEARSTILSIQRFNLSIVHISHFQQQFSEQVFYVIACPTPRPIKSVFPVKLKTIDQFSNRNTPKTNNTSIKRRK